MPLILNKSNKPQQERTQPMKIKEAIRHVALLKPMTSIEILDQLLKGQHLEPRDLGKAKILMTILKAELESRTEEKSK